MKQWSVVPLNSICRPKQWPTIPKSSLLEDGYTVYGANGIIGRYSEFNHEFPTVLITCRGATCGTLNICSPQSYVTGNAMALDSLNEAKADLKFLFYALSSRGLKDAITGTAQPQITRQSLEKVQIPLPPLKEQKRIAAILDKADTIRKKRKQAIELTEQFLRSAFLDMFGDLITNPKGLPRGTIRDLVSEVKYGSSSKAGLSGTYPILRMGNITYSGGWNFSDLKYINLSEKDKTKYLVENGDLLFNRTNSKELVGKSAVYRESKQMAYAGYLIRIRPNSLATSDYISGYLNSLHGKATLQNMCKNIVGMANINAQELQDIKIMIPPIDLQNKYSDLVESACGHQEKLGMIAETSSTLFDSLVQRAFRGEL